MPQRTSRQSAALRLNRSKSPATEDEENTPPDGTLLPASGSTQKKKNPKKTLAVQMAEKESRIIELEATVSQLSSDLLHLQTTHNIIFLEHQSLLAQKRDLSSTNHSLNCLKRKAVTAFSEELNKKQKRIRRLEREREATQEDHISTQSTLLNSLEDKTLHITRLLHDINSANNNITTSHLATL
ncbi:hypothetical protein C8R44DRAFT_888117 [Mycena epipterygia]|nr:hypothetical protein C8R44DRAFT_888117 [Mycena epipterygia]